MLHLESAIKECILLAKETSYGTLNNILFYIGSLNSIKHLIKHMFYVNKMDILKEEEKI